MRNFGEVGLENLGRMRVVVNGRESGKTSLFKAQGKTSAATE
jgi:AAA15 family ATPase/GTPase